MRKNKKGGGGVTASDLVQTRQIDRTRNEDRTEKDTFCLDSNCGRYKIYCIAGV